MNRWLFLRSTRFVTIATDLLLVNLAFLGAYLARYRLQLFRPIVFYEPYTDYLPQQLLLTLLVILTFSQTAVWAGQRGEFLIDEISRLVYGLAAALALMIMVTFFVQPLVFSRLLLIWLFVLASLLLALARILRRLLLTIRYQRGIGIDHALIIGSGEVGRSVIRTLLARPDLGLRAIGYLDDGQSENNIGSGRIPHLGTANDLPRILQESPQIRTLFIALPAHLHQQTTQLLRQAYEHDLQPIIVPDLFDLSLSRVAFSNFGGVPVFTIRNKRLSLWSKLVKRLIDLIILAILAVPLLLLGLLITSLIKLTSPGPILFAHERVGENGKPFKMYKFRSMIVGAEAQKEALLSLNEATGPIFKIKNDPRLTPIGKLIRRLSLDEIPQFFNVLLGDMSIVGPRPPLAEEVAQYQEWHRQRLTVKGGITGLWQVSGRSDLTFDEQCLLDIYYIENWSPTFDLRLMIQTVPFMLFGRGAY